MSATDFNCLIYQSPGLQDIPTPNRTSTSFNLPYLSPAQTWMRYYSQPYQDLNKDLGREGRPNLPGPGPRCINPTYSYLSKIYK